MTVEKIGRRYYITGQTYAAKDALKAAGCKWDPDRRAWWTGKKEVAERFDRQAPAEAKPEDPDTIRVIGKARYKGRDYYIRWVGTCKTGEHKARLCTLDAKIDFWAACAEPGDRPAADEASVTKMYQEPRSLAGIRRFIEDRRAEEEAAKKKAAKLAKAAKGEPTRDIPNLMDDRVIAAFFGDRAVAYDFTVTQDQFDEEDNWGPGHYCGVTVPASLADRWDAGLKACRASGVDTKAREGYILRYRIMVQDDAAELPACLEELLAEREQKAAVAALLAEREQKAAVAALLAEREQKAAVAALLDGLVQSSVGPTAPETAATRINGEVVAHHMATADSGPCTFKGEGLVRISRDGVTYTEGRTPDGQRVVREDFRGYDDYRTYYWAPPAVAKAWALAYAASAGITVEKAREWLAQYDGCHGSDLYRAIVEQ